MVVFPLPCNAEGDCFISRQSHSRVLDSSRGEGSSVQIQKLARNEAVRQIGDLTRRREVPGTCWGKCQALVGEVVGEVPGTCWTDPDSPGSSSQPVPIPNRRGTSLLPLGAAVQARALGAVRALMGAGARVEASIFYDAVASGETEIIDALMQSDAANDAKIGSGGNAHRGARQTRDPRAAQVGRLAMRYSARDTQGGCR
jgi:hypothetical protein